jgi:hypothetical protein
MNTHTHTYIYIYIFSRSVEWWLKQNDSDSGLGKERKLSSCQDSQIGSAFHVTSYPRNITLGLILYKRTAGHSRLSKGLERAELYFDALSNVKEQLFLYFIKHGDRRNKRVTPITQSERDVYSRPHTERSHPRTQTQTNTRHTFAPNTNRPLLSLAWI